MPFSHESFFTLLFIDGLFVVLHSDIGLLRTVYHECWVSLSATQVLEDSIDTFTIMSIRREKMSSPLPSQRVTMFFPPCDQCLDGRRYSDVSSVDCGSNWCKSTGAVCWSWSLWYSDTGSDERDLPWISTCDWVSLYPSHGILAGKMTN